MSAEQQTGLVHMGHAQRPAARLVCGAAASEGMAPRQRIHHPSRLHVPHALSATACVAWLRQFPNKKGMILRGCESYKEKI